MPPLRESPTVPPEPLTQTTRSFSTDKPRREAGLARLSIAIRWAGSRHRISKQHTSRQVLIIEMYV
jgi:hypothetical protein